jgi:hypothetical protein
VRLSRINCSHRRKDQDLQRTYESCGPPDSSGRSASLSFGIALCFACRLVNSGLFDDRPFRGCVAAFWIWNKGALRSREDPIRPAHSAPALRDTAQARPPFPERANHAEQPICPDRLIELCGGSGSGRGSERERERLQIDYHGIAIPSQLPPATALCPCRVLFANTHSASESKNSTAQTAQHSTSTASLPSLTSGQAC